MANLSETFIASAELNEDLCYGKAWPLPRLSPPHTAQGNDQYEIVVVGAGPAGLLLTLQLARLGLSDESLLCIDTKVEGTKAGHADGVNARSLEILATLGLEAEIRRDGNVFSEIGMWRQSEQDPSQLRGFGTAPFMEAIPVRFERLTTIHQGRIERIFRVDLSRYSKRGVQYATSAQKVSIDESANSDYPIEVVLEHGGQTRRIRTKYLVGADGAHSVVRRSMNIEMQGEVTDRIWGVVDFVADTNFPDVRRPCIFQSLLGEGRGDALLIPRERLSDGNYMSRLYIDLTDYEDGAESSNGYINGEDIEMAPEDGKLDSKAISKKKRAAVTIETILEKGAKFMNPYRFGMKQGTQPFWWASYSVGQRLANDFIVKDSAGTPRVFLVGDACHTHSPRQGQGMNISMQDSHNLAWKLAHVIHGLSPTSVEFLRSYETERHPAAERVVFFDKRWNQSTVTREEMLREGSEQVLGCAVDYDTSLLVGPKAENFHPTGHHYPVNSDNYSAGALRPGRRLLNVKVRRFADGSSWDIHDDLRADGRWRIIVLCTTDFPNPQGKSLVTVTSICERLIKTFPRGIIEASILQPEMAPRWGWDELPPSVKDEAEMRLHCAGSEVYTTWGVDVEKGALAVVRPDGHVGMVAQLDDVDGVEKFLRGILIPRRKDQ